MFGPPGHLYVYFTYGMHVCCNVVCGPEGTAGAVLLRAGEVVGGLEPRAPGDPPRGRRDRDLARGPARLCQALGIELEPRRRRPGAPGRVHPRRWREPPSTSVSTGPRVGLRERRDRPWRFWVDGGAERVGVPPGGARPLPGLRGAPEAPRRRHPILHVPASRC